MQLQRIKNMLLRTSLGKPKQYKKSYSQCGEDLIIDFIFSQKGVTRPSYIDIGAHHPYYLSNTALFSEKGSKGINIEPDPYLFSQFIKARPHDINLNVGAGQQDGYQDFYIMSTPTMNTFSKTVADELVETAGFSIKEVRPTQLLCLNTILNKYYASKFPDLFSLDVEGLDEMIIQSIDFRKSYPKVICVETLTYSDNGDGKKNDQLIELISSKGYTQYADTYINTIFVKEGLLQRK
jgi:FkbM family methyltransferase